MTEQTNKTTKTQKKTNKSQSSDQTLLPVGSVVYLEGGTTKLVVLARGQLVKQDESQQTPTLYDYASGLYPQGYDPENNYFFNHKDISEVVFEGYQDDEEIRYQKVLTDWQKEHAEEYIVQEEK